MAQISTRYVYVDLYSSISYFFSFFHTHIRTITYYLLSFLLLYICQRRSCAATAENASYPSSLTELEIRWSNAKKIFRHQKINIQYINKEM